MTITEPMKPLVKIVELLQTVGDNRFGPSSFLYFKGRTLVFYRGEWYVMERNKTMEDAIYQGDNLEHALHYLENGVPRVR